LIVINFLEFDVEEFSSINLKKIEDDDDDSFEFPEKKSPTNNQNNNNDGIYLNI
jgi:hypothetical protein